jgi:hypothetical protein
LDFSRANARKTQTLYDYKPRLPTSRRIPGPIVVDSTTFFRYAPFEAAGLDRFSGGFCEMNFFLSASGSIDGLTIEQ